MTIDISTDGSCYPNPGPGGWACIFRLDNKAKVLYGYEEQSTNIRMELTAAIKALEHLKVGCNINLYTDSRFMVDGITSWIKRWKRNGFKTQPFKNTPSKDVANQDLWKRLDLATQRHTINWIWIKGHAGHWDNITCDKYAEEARTKKYTEVSLDLSTPSILPINDTINDFDIFSETVERNINSIS